MLRAAEGMGGGWQAGLDLRFFPSGPRTAMDCEHFGPLRVQKPFHPEGAACHVYLLHPPGGVVGGDGLNVRVTAQAGAAGLVTTPGAGKFYRSAGPLAVQTQELRVEAGASLEWLPQETIVYPGANAVSRTRVDLQPGARFFGWELTAFGLPESGAAYDRGSFEQRFEISRGGEPLLLERCRYEGGSRLMAQAWGLGGRTAMGALFATAEAQDLAARTRAAVAGGCALAPGEAFSATQLDGLVVCRALAYEARRVRTLLALAWAALRPAVLGRPACPPRVWNT